MTETVNMPQLGESVTEGTIARWLKQAGETLERYEAIAEVITDKVNAEIPSPIEGIMGQHLVEEGAVVPVGAPICTVESADVATAGGNAGAAPEPAAAAQRVAPGGVAGRSAAAEQAVPDVEVPGVAAPAPAGPAPTPVPVPTEAAPAPSAGGGNGRATQHVTPAVRMLAREHAIDLGEVPGTGIGGRVTKKDILTFVQQRGAALAPAAAPPAAPAVALAAAAAAPASASATAPAPAPTAAAAAAPAAAPVPAPVAAPGEDTVVPLTPARRAIAEHMVRSRQTSPHAFTLVEVDMSAVARVRAANRTAFTASTGADLTFLPFVARAVISALRRQPTLNASFGADGIVLHRDINLGIAVALDDNLIVPVLRSADSLSLVGLARSLRDLAERARARRLRVDELGGGTFTLNNAGALGTVLSQAIINQPQAAICVMDAIIKRPVVVGDAIAIRSMMNLSVSFDHRINDGLQATRFLVDVKHQLEGIDEAAPLV